MVGDLDASYRGRALMPAAVTTQDAQGPQSRPIPRATYRLQLNRDFGFDDAAALAPYLAELGISHVYCSPYLRARPGSTHGYDIVSHTELNPELGGPEAFARMVEAFRQNGLGQIVDFVPNHMGVGGADNPQWLDMLEWGRASEFAGWFDVDWEPEAPYLRDKALVPFLGEQYGAALESGALELLFDADAGAFAVWAYKTHKLPICPHHYEMILGDFHPGLERLGDAFSHLSASGPYFGSRARALQAQLAELTARDRTAADAVDQALRRFAGETGDLSSWRALDSLIGLQHWRLAHFRVASDDINYRRFFDVNELARIRMELPELFDHAHALIFRLLADGVLDGLRIDHIDGLLDPKRYCLQLREKAPRPFYLVVEKILARHEDLREDWDVEGATGYEVANLVTGLLLDPAGEEPLTRLYRQFSGNVASFGEIVQASKTRIVENELASELNALAHEVAAIARSNPRTADFTKNVLARALKQIIAAFPVYRTYVDESAAPTAADRRDIDWALAQARRRDDAIDPSVFDFLHGLMTGDLVARPRSGFSAIATIRAAMRIQQYSGPVMAKGLEDTAFYRYGRMLALNEVGGNPGGFNVSVSAFHHAMQRRAKQFPHAMTSTATHDSKRGEDVRARLAVLSECPDEWAQQVAIWSRILHAGEVGSPAEPVPDRNDEYIFYQLLLGSWPLEISGGDRDPALFEAFGRRLEGAMVKSMREAKLHTTWAAPNSAYEDGVIAFIRSAMDVSRKNAFLESFAAFESRIAEAGMRNGLIQTVLKFTLPGAPDIYQGGELWDLNFVDPDNRRPVDYQRRKQYLREMRGRSAAMSADALPAMIANWRDGRLKLALTSKLLELRKRSARAFREGAYEPLPVTGGDANRLCAFARTIDGETIVVALMLFPLRAWSERSAIDAVIAAPSSTPRSAWVDVLTGRRTRARDGAIAARDLFCLLPAAVLIPTTEADADG
jgi:(1->4)-alpha-D-glucan 1-alpha-D-glucosylmutase